MLLCTLLRCSAIYAFPLHPSTRPQFEASGMVSVKGRLWIVFDNLHRWVLR